MVMKMTLLDLKTPTIKREVAIRGGKMFYFRKRMGTFCFNTAILDVTDPIMGVKRSILKPENRRIRRCKADFDFMMVIMNARMPIMNAKMAILNAMMTIMVS